MDGIFKLETPDLDHTAAYLEGSVRFWSFSQLLKESYEGTEPLSKRLLEKLLLYEGADRSGERREQVARRIRNWMGDRNRPANREELFRICFALGLDEGRAAHILGTTAEDGIHYRNPRELIYAFCLRSGIDYPRARQMVDQYESRGAGEDSGGTECMTASVRDGFKRVATEAELWDFLERHRPRLGVYHNTAYRKFLKMLNQLACPSGGWEQTSPEPSYSVERVVEEYLRMGIPYERRTGRYTWVQRTVKKHWPTPKTVGEMYRRKTDVDRKTLILLYLATEGTAVTQQEEGGLALRERQTGRELLMEHRSRIDLMLTECGMSVLNLNSPFDYFVMQAVRREQEEEPLSARMERILRGAFCRGQAACVTAAGRRRL